MQKIITTTILLFLVVIVAGCATIPLCPPVETTDEPKECVVILHGLGRTSRSMEPMAEALMHHSYNVVNLDYPSRQKTIGQIVAEDFPEALNCTKTYNCSLIHFVTHSMGGLVVRMALEQDKPVNLGRVVMLSPPNQGSELADFLNESFTLGWFYGWLNGPAGKEIGTGPEAVPNQLGPVTYPTGVIVGKHHNGFDFWFSKIIPGDDDGKVSIERAKVAGMSDFLIVPYNHTSIMKKQDVMAETIYFIKNGRFKTTTD